MVTAALAARTTNTTIDPIPARPEQDLHLSRRASLSSTPVTGPVTATTATAARTDRADMRSPRMGNRDNEPIRQPRIIGVDAGFSKRFQSPLFAHPNLPGKFQGQDG